MGGGESGGCGSFIRSDDWVLLCVYIPPLLPRRSSSCAETMRALTGSGRHDSYCTGCGSYDALFTVCVAHTVCTRRTIVQLGM